MKPVMVIGVDGRPLPPVASERLAAATLVVGAARHLRALPVPASAKQHPLGDIRCGLDAIEAHAGDVVVLASGDPGFFGIVRLLRESGIEVDVEPAVSSVSAAFGLAGLSWDDAAVISAHGRDLRRAINACLALPKVAVLTDPGSGPAALAAGLLGSGRRMLVAERLGGPEQRLSRCTPEEAAGRKWRDPNVVLVLAEAAPTRGWAWPPRQAPNRWALPDDAFERRDGMVTKSEVRAIALAHLGPGVGDLVWDIGAGTGSVGIECARFGAAVIAVERDAQQCDRLRRNAQKHRVHLRVVPDEAPGCLPSLPQPDAVFVGGGGLPTVTRAAACGARTVVVALAAIDRVGPTRDVLRAASYDVGGAEIGAHRLADLPDGSSRLAATNPVFLLWGHR